MNLALIFLLIFTGVKGSEEEISRFFTNGHGGLQFYHAQEKYDKLPHKPRTSTTTTELPQEEIFETTITTSTTVRTIPTTLRTISIIVRTIPTTVRTIPTTVRTILTTETTIPTTPASIPDTNPTTTDPSDVSTSNPTTSSTTIIPATNPTTVKYVRRIVGNSLRRRPTTISRTSSISETTERSTRFSNLKRRRRPTTITPTTTTTPKSESTIRKMIDSDKELDENEIKTTEDADLEYSVGSSSATEGTVDFSTKFNRFYKKERTTTEENNEILDVSTENVKKFAPKIYSSHFKLRRPTPRPTTEKTNPKIKRHDVHVLSTNLIMEKRRKIYQGYIRKPSNTLTENTSSKVAVMINRKAMPKIQIGNRNLTSTAKTNPTLLKGKDLYARKPSEKYMQLRQKEKPKVEDGISALRKRHLSSVNYFRQHALKFS